MTITVPPSGTAIGVFDIVRHPAEERTAAAAHMAYNGGAQIISTRLPRSPSTAATRPVTMSSSRARCHVTSATSATPSRQERTRAVTFPMSRPSATLVALATASGASAAAPSRRPRRRRSPGPRNSACPLRITVVARHPRPGRPLAVRRSDRGPRSRRAAGARDRHARRDLAGGVLADYGRLSARTVVTGDDGIARLVYTAPPPLAEPVDPYTVVTLLVTPISGDFAGAELRAASTSGWCRRRRYRSSFRPTGRRCRRSS